MGLTVELDRKLAYGTTREDALLLGPRSVFPPSCLLAHLVRKHRPEWLFA